MDNIFILWDFTYTLYMLDLADNTYNIGESREFLMRYFDERD